MWSNPWRDLHREDSAFRPTAHSLDRMHAGLCGWCSGDQLAVVDITVLISRAGQPFLWCLCERHGRECLDLYRGRVYWLAVEESGWAQGELDLEL